MVTQKEHDLWGQTDVSPNPSSSLYKLCWTGYLASLTPSFPAVKWKGWRLHNNVSQVVPHGQSSAWRERACPGSPLPTLVVTSPILMFTLEMSPVQHVQMFESIAFG